MRSEHPEPELWHYFPNGGEPESGSQAIDTPRISAQLYKMFSQGLLVWVSENMCYNENVCNAAHRNFYFYVMFSKHSISKSFYLQSNRSYYLSSFLFLLNTQHRPACSELHEVDDDGPRLLAEHPLLVRLSLSLLLPYPPRALFSSIISPLALVLYA